MWISDKAMTMILELLNDAFEHAKIPNSLYEEKQKINKLGLNYTKIRACPNDCMLYWGRMQIKMNVQGVTHLDGNQSVQDMWIIGLVVVKNGRSKMQKSYDTFH